jgi:hypothetical protein
MFFEGVWHHLQFCLLHLICGKNGGLSVLSLGDRKVARGEVRQVGWMGYERHVRKCETVHCRDATASYFVAKTLGEVFAHFHAVTLKHQSNRQN